MPAKKDRKELTTTSVVKLKPRAGRSRDWFPDTQVPGFGVRVTDKGSQTYVLRTRYPGSSNAARREIGKVGAIGLSDARDKARRWLALIGEGKDPAKVEAERRDAQIDKDANTVNAILDDFVKRHVSKLRSADQVKHALDRYVRPQIGESSIYDLKRRQIVELLDAVEDEAGPVMADRTLAHLRKAFNWQATRDDEFMSPIVRGMARTKPKERARQRVLTDDEIRDIWQALETADLPSCYPRYVKMLLLTMTRRNESADMNAAEIEGDLWTIPGGRYKTKLDHVIPLSPDAKALIGAKPAKFKGKNWFVFSTTGGEKSFSGFSKAKKALDVEIAKRRKAEGREKIPGWTLHDLRRTARTLMSRAKVPEDHAERSMGHIIAGVRGTYDRHKYLDEKREAFRKLADLVAIILDPPADNVLRIDGVRA
ncbi:MAG: integrase arm-type DNA-binding domain-containing protein [Rhizobiales bacterium]|nr:integrase arm-type DNA-binding domain-containing protein [Hyphomicrobiales bacterium]